jgi:dienelactone hydrolase
MTLGRFTKSMPARYAFGVLALSVLLGCSCAHHACDPAYAGPKTRPAEMLEYYSYPDQRIEAKVETIASKKHYVIERVEFPSALNVFDTANIHFDFYVQNKEGRFPTIIIWSIPDDADFCAKGFARRFAANGFNCAVMHNRKIDLDDIASAEQVEDYFRQTVLDARQVVDYLVERERVDADKLGCMGVSLGGIRASVVSAVDERLKCSVIGFAGGSMADIALGSKLGGVKDYVKGLAEMGVTPDVIRAEMSAKIQTDPLALAPYVDAGNVLMYIAAFDNVVPRKCGDRLWEAMGKPEVVYLFSGHFTSLLYLPYAEYESLSFFKRKLQVR